ncbi:MAG: hypothetical protein M1822_007306 [Bathelium mastoideum]|nr:MAG: hypothetical protein M1822_007306 [Bathelium mastoideum]
MAPDKASRTLFVGNIAYAASEEQITDMLSQVGQRPQFRLILDRETGQPKGFGFATFQDTDAAASAVRNLNAYEFLGRTLRVDYSNENDNDAPPAGYSDVNGQDGQSSALPPLPLGRDMAPNLSCEDEISNTLNAMSPPQLLDIISQIKNLVTTDPAKATELLKQAPQLSYAIFQALLLLNLIETTTLSSILQGGTLPQPQAPAPPVQPQFNPYRQQPYPPYGVEQPLNVPTPPVQQQPYQPPPSQPAQPAQPEQAQLVQMVMSLTMDQINAMPPAERDQIMAVRNHIMPSWRSHM